ncbi:MBL fold metallo-hydrolase [Hydrogenophaga sp.]|uniref:MBL fold metallo-hydrolase n=1 Tax=Hydrogenophaga sp. TaxID=1904254 RepID=UPI0025BB4CD7|nr:MBL fold metallo-hydrolase [Hydrogenophaga sp.]
MNSFGQRATGERLERMRASPLWHGTGFRNQHPVLPGLRDPSVPMPSPKEFLLGGERRVPDAPLPSLDPRQAWSRTPASGLRATWLGHSTVLLEMDGHRVLTDPVWGKRASPFALLGPKRFQPVPLRLRQMPEVDVVVISHDHYDHLDYPTIRALARHSAVPFVTSLGVGAHLQAWGVAPQRIIELDWWETHRVLGTGLTITAAPSQHFSGRGLKDRNATLWSSMVVRSERHAVFFSGDTGLTTEYTAIRDRLGPFDLVMLEVGAFHPAWGDIHLGPLNALKAHALLGSGAFMPVHWGTFSLAMHAWDEPADTLLAHALVPEQLLMPRLGEAVEPANTRPVQTWWRQPGGEQAVPAMHSVQTPAPDGDPKRELPWPLD